MVHLHKAGPRRLIAACPKGVSMKTKMGIIFVALVAAIVPVTVFAQLPYLEKSASSTRMIVNGKPFLVLAGELHNSTSSDIEALSGVWKRMAGMNLNTVIATASWELVEPVEGTYDFTLVDAILEGARKENLKIVLIWFGSWKSTDSRYVPQWVKTNPKRFPRYALENGSTLEILSAFSDENMKADAKAYAALMHHVREVDAHHSVIMTQVENEPGFFGAYRDYSADALKAWKAPVPPEMINYLKTHRGFLFPALEKAWSDSGYRTEGTWEQVFGKSSDEGEYKRYTEELFTAFYYSKFLNYVAAQGRKELDLPAFCNAWAYNKDGIYPHGTCNPHVLDAYRAAGTALDFYSPNSYSTDYDTIFPQWTLGGNTLFIPESGVVPAGVLYSIGEFDSLGFSPFGIDGDRISSDAGKSDLQLFSQIYKILGNMMGFVTSQYGSEKMRGLYIHQKKTEQRVEIGDYLFTASSSRGGGFGMGIDFGKSIEQIGQTQPSPLGEPDITAPKPVPGTSPVQNSGQAFAQPGPPQLQGQAAAPSIFGDGIPTSSMGSAIIIQTQENEFIVLGFGIRLHIALKEGIKFQHLGFDSIDEGFFRNDTFIPRKRWNGDELRAILPEANPTVLRIRLYHY